MAFTDAFEEPRACFGDLYELSVEEAAQVLFDGLWDHEQATVEQIQAALEAAIQKNELVPIRGTVRPIGAYNSNPAVLDAFEVAKWAETRGLELESNGAFFSYIDDEATLASELSSYLEYLRNREDLGEEETELLEEKYRAFTPEEQFNEYMRLTHENEQLRKQLAQRVEQPCPHGNAERHWPEDWGRQAKGEPECLETRQV